MSPAQGEKNQKQDDLNAVATVVWCSLPSQLNQTQKYLEMWKPRQRQASRRRQRSTIASSRGRLTVVNRPFQREEAVQAMWLASPSAGNCKDIVQADF
jgi:hypothetical protein